MTAMIFDEVREHPDAVAVTVSVRGLELRAENVMDLVDAPAVIEPPVIVQL